jgi:hypothetical protein
MMVCDSIVGHHFARNKRGTDYTMKASFILNQSESCPVGLPILALQNGQKGEAWVQKELGKDSL